MATVTRAPEEEVGWSPPMVLFLSGILGGIAGAVLTHLSVHGELRVSFSFLGPAQLIFIAAAWAGGVLAGWLVATLTWRALMDGCGALVAARRTTADQATAAHATSR